MQSEFNENEALFYESQKFKQVWLWIILIITAVILIIPFSYGIITQIVFGQPWLEGVMSNKSLLLTGGPSIFIGIANILLFINLELITFVKTDGLYYRFRVLQKKWRCIRKEDIEHVAAVTYRPLRDYGGWGIRFSRKGRAYNVSGNQGVQIHLKNEKNILIGSKKSEELKQSIEKLRNINIY